MTRKLLFLVAIPLVWGCGDTARGVKKDAGDIAEKTAEMTAEAGEALKAGTKSADVKLALIADSLIAGSAIDVDGNSGAKTITLNGEVGTAAARMRAEEIARKHAPEYTIVNNLTVRQR